MKFLICVLLLLPTSLISQHTDVQSVYTGIYVSTAEGSFGFIQFEDDGGLAIFRCEYLTDFKNDHRLYVKMEYQVYHTKNFRFFVAMPPFHWVPKEKGYNTPFNVEVIFKNKLVLNLDIYRDNINISAQLRYKF